MLRRPTLTENKIMLLYMIRQVGVMTNQQALRLAVENDIMDYIDLQLSLAQLTESGMLSQVEAELGTVYVLTTLGGETLSMFERDLPASRRAGVDEIKEAWARRFQRERQLPSRYWKDNGGEYRVNMRVLEAGLTLMDLTLSTPERAQARLLQQNFENRADRVYKQILHLLYMSDSEYEAFAAESDNA